MSDCVSFRYFTKLFKEKDFNCYCVSICVCGVCIYVCVCCLREQFLHPASEFSIGRVVLKARNVLLLDAMQPRFTSYPMPFPAFPPSSLPLHCLHIPYLYNEPIHKLHIWPAKGGPSRRPPNVSRVSYAHSDPYTHTYTRIYKYLHANALWSEVFALHTHTHIYAHTSKAAFEWWGFWPRWRPL